VSRMSVGRGHVGRVEVGGGKGGGVGHHERVRAHRQHALLASTLADLLLHVWTGSKVHTFCTFCWHKCRLKLVTHTHTPTRAHTHTCTHAHAHAHTCTHAHAQKYTHAHTHMHTHTRAHAHGHEHAYTQAPTHAQMRTLSRTCAHTRTHVANAHTHMHTHTHMRSLTRTHPSTWPQRPAAPSRGPPCRARGRGGQTHRPTQSPAARGLVAWLAKSAFLAVLVRYWYHYGAFAVYIVIANKRYSGLGLPRTDLANPCVWACAGLRPRQRPPHPNSSPNT